MIKLYLTSLEPDMEQTIFSQSIGGYCSNSLLYPEAAVSSTIGLYDMFFNLNLPISGSWSEWTGITYISIGNEIIKVSPVFDGNISVVQRGYNGIINMHIGGDIARGINSRELFNNVFNEERKQYRCLALKNLPSLNDPSLVETNLYDLSVYMKQNSRNLNSVIKIALEKPNSQYLSSKSTAWNSMQIIDNSLIGLYPDNHFKDAYLKVIGGEADGQGKIVSSFDSYTGTFTFYNSFSSSYNYLSNFNYIVYPSPSQRIKTGTIKPDMTNSNILFFYPSTESVPQRFITKESSFNISDLKLNEIMYIWIEREVKKGSEFFSDNNLIFNITHKVN